MLVVGAWAAVLVVLLVEQALATWMTPRPVFALLDWLAHVATALVIFAPVVVWSRAAPRPLLLGVLAGAVLVDLDHLPMELAGSDLLTRGLPRPVSHSMLTVLCLGAASLIVSLWRGGPQRVRRAWAAGLAGSAVGVCLHLWRDLATAPVVLWWPLSAQQLQVPYVWYADSLVVAALSVTMGAHVRSRRIVSSVVEERQGGPAGT